MKTTTLELTQIQLMILRQGLNAIEYGHGSTQKAHAELKGEILLALDDMELADMLEAGK
jgi:hypothetical protein